MPSLLALLLATSRVISNIIVDCHPTDQRYCCCPSLRPTAYSLNKTVHPLPDKRTVHTINEPTLASYQAIASTRQSLRSLTSRLSTTPTTTELRRPIRDNTLALSLPKTATTSPKTKIEHEHRHQHRPHCISRIKTARRLPDKPTVRKHRLKPHHRPRHRNNTRLPSYNATA